MTLTDAIRGALSSEHCSYKSTRHLIATLPKSAPWVPNITGENAGILNLPGDYLLAFKIESHNHPSFIDPFSGAATGVGGIIRDVSICGATPVGLTNLTVTGQKDSWHHREIVKGMSWYGNTIGLPTVQTNHYHDPRYANNPLVNCGCIGEIRPNRRLSSTLVGGGYFVYIGRETGRDGIGGAEMASDQFSGNSDRGAIQTGDPYGGRKLMLAIDEMNDKRLLQGGQDCGAAGLASAIVEICSKTGCGVDIKLDDIPVRETGMTPTELWLSETQERAVVIIPPRQMKEAEAICSRLGLPIQVIGTITATGMVRAYYGGELVLDMRNNVSVSEEIKYIGHPAPIVEPVSQSRYFDPSIYQQFDSTVGGRTRKGPEALVGELVLSTCEIGVTTTIPENGSDPEEIVQHLLDQSRMLQDLDYTPVGLSNCINGGSPEDPQGYKYITQMFEAIKRFCTLSHVPVVSGNVSLRNATAGVDIPPTPAFMMIGVRHD